MSQEELPSTNESLTNEIETTRRQFLGGIGAGTGLASSGLLAGGWSHRDDERLYHLDWSCVYDH
ncbi:twin-arginine translocation signal domain-containing protein [Natronococcus jeotgali]|uniref:Uncharacterized protein n=1 Tax=Natronococcus jeotgali DSM 18795 TaxID=1227498 RepID=L9XWI0_9EURY|nr:hypothetical protein C492_01363 [Natronococcus jeotgali DSM 18795]